VDPGQLRRAKNEALFREENERIAELETGLSGYGERAALLVGFGCECGNEDCGETLDVTQAQYESVRSNPRRFLVFPGHEDSDVARVVERHRHFVVVEKLDEAAEIAIEQDPHLHEA
jgi:hypothetical protein